ncbi:exonuclease domain-containing protein [Spiroplasma endosymbiont of Labia minor]|uniref:exonuclease domain-containing protein n=1 Tax=Spiroplasma endosymbiont of Labia minor TaxID=3066305 RepID=UPI0030D45BA2
MNTYKGALFLDVETANSKQNSICQLSFMIINNDHKEVFSFNEYIKPFEHYYENEFQFTDIHGITWNDVKHKRKFNAIWNDIKSFFNSNYLIFAHNASFDITCIQKTIDYYNISKPNFNYACTYLPLKK